MNILRIILVSIFGLLLLFWLLAIIIIFAVEPFGEALIKIFGTSILFAIPFSIILFIGWLIDSRDKKYINKVFVPLEQLKGLFENKDLPWQISSSFDFSKYTQYSHLDKQKDSLSLVYQIDFSTLQYTATSPIVQNFFTTLIESLNASNKWKGTIYDLLQTIVAKVDLYLENTAEKDEILKIMWYLLEFIKIKLKEKIEDLHKIATYEPDDELDLELKNYRKCIHALEYYTEDLKMRLTINAISLYSIQNGMPNIIEFCKEGKWQDFAERLESKDRETLEMLILKDIYKASLEWGYVGTKFNKKLKQIVNDKILTTLNFKESFKSYGATYFFEILSNYLQEKERLNGFYTKGI